MRGPQTLINPQTDLTFAVLLGTWPLRRQLPAKHSAVSYTPLAVAEPVSSGPGAGHSAEDKIRGQGIRAFSGVLKKRRIGKKFLCIPTFSP